MEAMRLEARSGDVIYDQTLKTKSGMGKAVKIFEWKKGIISIKTFLNLGQ